MEEDYAEPAVFLLVVVVVVGLVVFPSLSVPKSDLI